MRVEKICPRCNSEEIVKNGCPHKGKRQWRCKECGKYFTENTVDGCPPTTYPFQIIAYILYIHKKSPQFQDMRKLRKFVNQLFDRLVMKDTNISRHTIRYWIDNYEPRLEKCISFKDACRYVSKRDIICKIARKSKPNLKTLPRGSHLEGLKNFCMAYGEKYVLEMIRNNNDEVNRICKFFGWNKLPKKHHVK